MKRVLIAGLTLTCLGLAIAALAGNETKPATTPGTMTGPAKTMMTTPAGTMMGGHITKMAELTWKDAAGYPVGCKMAEVHSDAKAMIMSAYMMFPAGTKVAAHTHPATHWGTVVSGTCTFGLGTDPTKGTDMGPGDFVSIPAGTPHWLVAKTDCTVFATAMGAPGMTYINPTDDPRKGQAESH